MRLDIEKPRGFHDVRLRGLVGAEGSHGRLGMFDDD